jgi:hypothetical protein
MVGKPRIDQYFKKRNIPKLSLVFIPIGVGLFIAGVFSDNGYFQSLGIAIPIGFEMFNRITSMRKTNYDFSINYHKHSKEIVKIIKSGFGGESGILGRCNDENGILIIQKPREPEIEDIGLARSHLQNGYPDYWKLEEEAVRDSVKILEEIRQIKDNFETKVIKVMEQILTKSQSTPVRKDSHYTLQTELFQSCYYDDLITELFYEIRIRKRGKLPRKLIPGFSFVRNGVEQNQTTYQLSFEQNGKALVSVKEEDREEIKSRIEGLLLDPSLKDMVCRYTTLKDRLDENKNRKEYFQKIDDLHKSIYLEGQSLNKEGKCSLCPLEPY